MSSTNTREILIDLEQQAPGTETPLENISDEIEMDPDELRQENLES
jgi:hypothetical protein